MIHFSNKKVDPISKGANTHLWKRVTSDVSVGDYEYETKLASRHRRGPRCDCHCVVRVDIRCNIRHCTGHARGNLFTQGSIGLWRIDWRYHPRNRSGAKSGPAVSDTHPSPVDTLQPNGRWLSDTGEVVTRHYGSCDPIDCAFDNLRVITEKEDKNRKRLTLTSRLDTYFEKPRFARLFKDGQAQRCPRE
jgi:hypothetical protein